jgi:hypothetical protein
MSKATDVIKLFEAKGKKPGYGTADGKSYAVLVDGVDSEFFKAPFGRQIDDLRKIKAFKETAKSGYAGAKGKSTLAAVKEWVKLNEPTQFYASWKADSSYYKDDSVQIFYTE